MIRSVMSRTVFIPCLMAMGLSACANDEATNKGAMMAKNEAVVAADTGNNLYQGQGAELYADYCSACHQEQGEGIEGTYPAFPQNVFVNGPAEEVIFLLLEGRAGMPTFIEDLTSEEMANVISHIRNSWGNKAGLVTKEQVEKAREEVEEDDSGYSREGD